MRKSMSGRWPVDLPDNFDLLPKPGTTSFFTDAYSTARSSWIFPWPPWMLLLVQRLFDDFVFKICPGSLYPTDRGLVSGLQWLLLVQRLFDDFLFCLGFPYPTARGLVSGLQWLIG
eukprot:1144357-Pelagomonas_calceolata.AAC.6